VVVDTSVLLAVIFNDAHSVWAAEQLQLHAAELRMSTVNLTEVLILIQDRQPQFATDIRNRILRGSIRFVAPTVEHAHIAADARLKYPLNLGDCFAYALAKTEGCRLLTLDGDFRRSDARVVMPA
jgi:ribonuclease VapC